MMKKYLNPSSRDMWILIWSYSYFWRHGQNWKLEVGLATFRAALFFEYSEESYWVLLCREKVGNSLEKRVVGSLHIVSSQWPSVM